MSDETFFGDGLLGQFTNVGVALQDRVVAKPGRSVFHRIAPTTDPDQPKPACRAGSTDTDWQATDLETVRRSGLKPCQTCYEDILEFLAQQPESPVELRNNSPTAIAEVSPDTTGFDPIIEPSVPSLTVLTNEVLVQSSEIKVMHAPTADGPLCEQPGDFRRVDPDAVDPHYRPCKDCFDLPTD